MKKFTDKVQFIFMFVMCLMDIVWMKEVCITGENV